MSSCIRSTTVTDVC